MARRRLKPAGPNQPRSWLEDPSKFGTSEAIWRAPQTPATAAEQTAREYRVWMAERDAAVVQHRLALRVVSRVRESGMSLREALDARQVPYNYSSLTRVLSGERAVRLAVLFALASAFDIKLPLGET